MQQISNQLKGVLCVLAASILFGLTPSFTTVLLQEGYPGQSLMFFRFLFASISSIGLALVKRTDFRVTKRQLLELAFFGVFGWGMTGILMTKSFEYIPSGLATMFHFSYPIIVLITSVIWFGEQFDWRKLMAVATAVAGIACIVDLGGEMSLIGIGLALTSGATYAAFVIAGKRSSYVLLPAQLVPCYCCIFCTIVYGCRVFLTGQFVIPISEKQWILLASTGVLGSTCACYLLTIGIRILGSSRASIINTLEPVTSLLCGVLILQEVITTRSFWGCMLISLSIILVAAERLPERKQTMQGG